MLLCYILQGHKTEYGKIRSLQAQKKKGNNASIHPSRNLSANIPCNRMALGDDVVMDNGRFNDKTYLDLMQKMRTKPCLHVVAL